MADDQPTIAKDTVLVNVRTNTSFQGEYDIWSWVPWIEFRVNGPIESGAQLYVQFSLPDDPKWVEFDCGTGSIEKGYWWKTEGGGVNFPEEKGVRYTGPVNFRIGLRNELMESDIELFKGTFEVRKAHSGVEGPNAAEKWVYYVDEDWTLPIGYVFLESDGDWKLPKFCAAFWIRGDYSVLDPHLFYQGKEVGKVMFEGMEIGKPSWNEELSALPSISVNDSVPQKAIWRRINLSFNNVRGWNQTGDEKAGFGTAPFLLCNNPGEYDLKVLRNGKLARSIKFTVGPDGKFDYGIASANLLGNDRAIVPVKVIGDQDGVWDREAWKTGAFYANPLTGFEAVS